MADPFRGLRVPLIVLVAVACAVAVLLAVAAFEVARGVSLSRALTRQSAIQAEAAAIQAQANQRILERFSDLLTAGQEQDVSSAQRERRLTLCMISILQRLAKEQGLTVRFPSQGSSPCQILKTLAPKPLIGHPAAPVPSPTPAPSPSPRPTCTHLPNGKCKHRPHRPGRTSLFGPMVLSAGAIVAGVSLWLLRTRRRTNEQTIRDG